MERKRTTHEIFESFRSALEEDSRGNMRRILKIPEFFVEHFHKRYGKNAFVVAQYFRDWRFWWASQVGKQLDKKDPFGIRENPEWDKPEHDDVWEIFLGKFELHADEERLFELVKASPNFAKRLQKEVSRDPVLSFVDQHKFIRDFVDPKAVERQSMMKVGAMFWVDLKRSECGTEADKMGHCGSDDRGTLVSLRDQSNEPHVTMTWNKERNRVLQVKGKGNDLPDRKYWPHIKKFFDGTKAEFYDSEVIEFAQEGNQDDIDFIKAVSPETLQEKPEKQVDVHGGKTFTLLGDDTMMGAGVQADLWRMHDTGDTDFRVNPDVEISISEKGIVHNIHDGMSRPPQPANWNHVLEFLLKFEEKSRKQIELSPGDFDFELEHGGGFSFIQFLVDKMGIRIIPQRDRRLRNMLTGVS